MRRASQGIRWLRAAGLAVLGAVLIGEYAAATVVSDSSLTSMPPLATAKISFIAGNSVYVTAGRDEGIAAGDTLTVLRAGKVVGSLVVHFLSSHRASCEPLKRGAVFQVEDDVRYRAREVSATTGAAAADTAGVVPGAPTAAAPAAPTAAVVAGAAVHRTPSRRSRPLRGRVAARYLSVDPQDAAGFTQPGMDLRLDARRIAGTGFDFTVDLRGRRTQAAEDTSRTTEARLYRATLSLHDRDEHVRATLGRQTSPSLAAISLFDGGLLRLDRATWGLGAFAGTEPDPADFAPSGNVLDAGLFYERRNRAGTTTRWSATGGFVASYDQGNINRHFFFLQAFASRPRWSLHFAQELDLNFGWKRDMGESSVTPSNTFVTGRLAATRTLDLRAGYDGRRNVLLYRDHETPEGEFDDRFRQGAWFGASWRPVRLLRIGGDTRWNGGNGIEGYQTWSGEAEVHRPEWLQSSLRFRGTRLTGSLSPGWLLVGGYTLRPLVPLELGVDVGSRSIDDSAAGGIGTTYKWFGGHADVLIARGLYLLISVERNESPGANTTQTWSSLSWAF